MSDFQHTMTVRCQLDDGSTLEMVNTYVVPGVLFVGQGTARNSDNLNINNSALANESADFFIARSVAGFCALGIQNGTDSADFCLTSGDVFVLPSNNGVTVDTNAGATTNPDPFTGTQIGTGTGPVIASVTWMTLNNTAS